MSQQKSKCSYASCGEEPFKSSKDGHCIYHAKAEDKSEREFKEALRNYIKKIKTIGLKHNFRGFVFVGDTNFEMDFEISVFRNAQFEEAEFYGSAFFVKAEFQGDTRFDAAKFHEGAHFEGARFQGDTSFVGVNFQGVAHFDGTEFQRDISFSDQVGIHQNAHLKETRFNYAEFHGEAFFIGAKFANVYFLRARFYENTRFIETEFEALAHFGGVDFRATAYILPKFIKKEVSFVHANLDNISLTPLNLGKNAWVFFTGARLRNTNIRREDVEGHIRQEKNEHYTEARDVYMLLKNNFHTIGRYDDESWAFKKEKDVERKNYFHTRPLKWLGSMFWNLLYGYGERPFWIFGWCGFLLLFSSFIYWLSKGVFHVMGACLIPVEDFWNNLYFSVVTFTTLGYGDFRPIGAVRVLASVESLLGIFLIALFIFAFARRTGGR